MASPSVLASSLLGVGLAGLYFGVAFLVARRAEGAWPRRLFAVFWAGIATYGLLDAAWALGVARGDVPLAVSLMVLHLKVAAAVTAFACLTSFMIVVYSGREGAARVVLAAYAVVFLVTTFFYAWRDPVGHHLTTWGASLEYAKPGGWFQRGVIVLLFVPPGVSAVAYALLLRHVKERRQRLRVATTSLALVALFSGLTLGWLNGTLPWWGLAEKVLALAAVLAVLAASWERRVTLPSRG